MFTSLWRFGWAGENIHFIPILNSYFKLYLQTVKPLKLKYSLKEDTLSQALPLCVQDNSSTGLRRIRWRTEEICRALPQGTFQAWAPHQTRGPSWRPVLPAHSRDHQHPRPAQASAGLPALWGVNNVAAPTWNPVRRRLLERAETINWIQHGRSAFTAFKGSQLHSVQLRR